MFHAMSSNDMRLWTLDVVCSVAYTVSVYRTLQVVRQKVAEVGRLVVGVFVATACVCVLGVLWRLEWRASFRWA